MLDATQIVIRPRITEKSAWQGAARNTFSFIVHPDANKHMIREAIAKIYNVRVENVATQIRKGKTRRTRYGVSKGSNQKIALVTLHEDDRIDLF